MFYIHIQDLLVFLDSVPKGILDEILALLLEEWFPEVQSLSVHSKNSLACSLMARLCSLYSQPAIWSQWFFSCWLPSKSLSLTLSGHGAKFSFSSLDSTNPVIVFLSDFDFNGSFAWTFFGGNHSHKLRAWGVSSDNNYCNITLHHTWRKLSRKTSWTRVTVCRLPINGGLVNIPAESWSACWVWADIRILQKKD